MPPFKNFTTKAKEAIRRAHELAIERGVNHVNPIHLLCSLILQEESMVSSILDKLEVDTMMLTDLILEQIEAPETTNVLSPSYQIYLTPDLASILEHAGKEAASLKDEFISTEHLFLAIFDVPGAARDVLARFKIDKTHVFKVVNELKAAPPSEMDKPKKFRTLSKYTRSLTKLAKENQLDPLAATMKSSASSRFFPVVRKIIPS
jgi:ATP-dependent Clp protease ATP-binding subunit ClpA